MASSRNAFLLLYLLLVCLAAAGCEGTVADEACPEESYLTYENFGGPLLLTWCTPCHSSNLPEAERQEAPMGSDFDLKQNILPYAEGIHDYAVVSDIMPPGGGLTEEERSMLGEWLGCGAP